MILEILNKIAATTKTKEKQNILQLNKDNELLKDIFRITYNKQVMFHVKKFPEVTGKGGTTPLHMAVSALLSDLSTRLFTGNAARDRLLDIVSSVNADDREVLRRIILRDLECGAGRTLPNRVWPKLIPEQPQCLATPYSEKAITRIKFPAISQLKADGARCMADLTDEGIRKVSRAGNEYLGLADLDESLTILQSIIGKNVVIDGELIYTGFVEPMKQVPTDLSIFFDDSDDIEEPDTILRVSNIIDSDDAKEIDEAKREQGNGIVNKSLKNTISDTEQKGIVFQVWDIIDYDVYYGNTESTVGYQDRLNELNKLITESGVINIQVVPTRIVNSLTDAKKDYTSYREQGKEGSILKNINFLWKDSRVPDQVKFKNKSPIDLRIIAVYAHKKDPNKAGGFVLVDSSGLLKTNSGSGLTDTTHTKIVENGVEKWEYVPLTLEDRGDLDREFIMNNQHLYINTIIELEVDGVQTSKTRKPDEPPYSLFLPVIKKIRSDKSEPNDVRVVFADVI